MSEPDAKKPEINKVIERLNEAFDQELPSKLAKVSQIWEKLVAVQTEPASEDARIEHRDKLIRLCHSLAGSAGTFGYPQLTEQARMIEGHLKKASLPISAEIVALLSNAIQSLHSHTNVVIETGMADAHDKQEENTALSAQTVHPRLIYIVERNNNLLEELTMQLESYDYQVQSFRSLSELSGAITLRPPAVLMMDAMMTRSETKKLLAALADDIRKQISLVMIADTHDMAMRLEAVRIGVNYFYTRPVDVSAVVDSIERITSKNLQRPCRVLIIDDSVSTAEFYGHALQQAGMTVMVETDGSKVLEVMTEFRSEVILLDLYMPGCSGLELAQIIRQDESYVDIPIVYLSGESNKDMKYAALELGADAFMTKPVKTHHLVSAVRTRVKRYRELKTYMHNDSLTGVLNHTNILTALESEIKRADRQGSDLSYVMLDLDHFKKINDTYGHHMGDIILKSVARLLLKRFRLSDYVGRYGGEEFVIILPETPVSKAHAICDSLREVISQTNFLHNGETVNIRASFGIADYKHYPSSRTIIDAADAALYEAKAAGRNCVKLAAKSKTDK